MTLYNNAAFLRGALESLRDQSYTDFAVVMLDDCSRDETQKIAQEFSRGDARFIYVCNDARRGMLGTWRGAFDIARTCYPSMRYFAWASDHDVRDRAWLEKLVGAIEGCEGAVMAFPLAQRIDEGGAPIPHDVRKGVFSTAHCNSLFERFQAVTRLRRNFGNMVYGLYVSDALWAAGVYRDTLIPDRLLMQELSLAGKIVQVEEVLWFRRFKKKLSLQSQLKSLWVPPRPWSSYLPWELVHTYFLFTRIVRLSPSQADRGVKFRLVFGQLNFAIKNLASRSLWRR